MLEVSIVILEMLIFKIIVIMVSRDDNRNNGGGNDNVRNGNRRRLAFSNASSKIEVGVKGKIRSHHPFLS